MSYYDRQYRPDPYARPGRRESGYEADFVNRRRQPRPPRVTSAYNRDYTWPEPAPPRFNPNPFAGDVRGRIADPRSVRYPYITRGGTWTQRGSVNPPPYDLPDYRPLYGGRYPDEL